MSDEKRGWQDVMIEHSKNDGCRWAEEAAQNGITFCGSLCETILKLEKEKFEHEQAIRSFMRDLRKFKSENDSLKSQLALAESAVDFYGDRRNWKAQDADENSHMIVLDNGRADLTVGAFGGKRARMCQNELAELRKSKCQPLE